MRLPKQKGGLDECISSESCMCANLTSLAVEEQTPSLAVPPRYSSATLYHME